MTLDELLVLNELFYARRTDSDTAGRLIQKGTREGGIVLERLVEKGLAEGKGERRGRVYHLTAFLYGKLGDTAGYIRTRGFEPIQQEQMIFQYVDAHSKITRTEASELCRISLDQASRLLRKLCARGLLVMTGAKPKGTYYTRIKNK